MTKLWRRAAAYMIAGDYYPLTECRKSNEDYYAMQFARPEEGDGFVQVVRNTKAEAEEFTLKLNVDADAVYTLEDGETGERFNVNGEDLKNGFSVDIPKRSGILLFYKKAGEQ